VDTITKIIPEAIKVSPVCGYCGKEKTPQEIEFMGIKKTVWADACNCYHEMFIKTEKEKHVEFLKNKFQSANIGKRYENITLESLIKLKTEHTEDAEKYIKEFNPESGKGLHFIGEFGNGKTSVGHAILKKLLPDYNCLFITWNEFVTRCNYAKSYDSEETIEQILNWISKFDLVMLDEFVINTRYETEINLACELFDRWYRDNKCYILINNPCDIEEMTNIKKLGKLFDRVYEQTTKHIFKNKSYRRQVYGGKYD